mgnify:CR=1 FL=1
MTIETKFNIGQTVSTCEAIQLRKVHGKKYVNNKKFKILYALHNIHYYQREENLFLTPEEAEAEQKRRASIDN